MADTVNIHPHRGWIFTYFLCILVFLVKIYNHPTNGSVKF